MSTNQTFKNAAVLLPAFMKDGEIYLIFTKRSELVQHHKNQICFPGGMAETLDKDLWQTALRETFEEIGVHPRQVFYICELPKIQTPTFFEITPYLGLIHSDFELKPNPDEIDHVFVAPLSHFLEPNNVRFEEFELHSQKIQVPFYRYQDYEIWGATGRILHSLLERL